MNALQRYRGPGREGVWYHPNRHAGFAHCPLSIIDLATGDQPMSDRAGNWVTYNSELYNYIELHNKLGSEQLISASDIEAILYTYGKRGDRE